MKRHVIYILVLLCLCFSCGLRTFYLIDPPINAEAPNPSDGDVISSPNDSNILFTFSARDLTSSVFINPGTDVYYRMYSSQDDLQSDAEKINDANDEDTNNGFKQLDTLGYKKLNILNGGENSLIDASGGRVIIQLIDNTFSDAYIRVSGSKIGTPIRYTNDYFNFDSTYPNNPSVNDEYELPKIGDSDFKSSSSSFEYVYVNAYAVSTGMDSSTFSAVQSEVLPLGFTAHEIK